MKRHAFGAALGIALLGSGFVAWGNPGSLVNELASDFQYLQVHASDCTKYASTINSYMNQYHIPQYLNDFQNPGMNACQALQEVQSIQSDLSQADSKLVEAYDSDAAHAATCPETRQGDPYSSMDELKYQDFKAKLAQLSSSFNQGCTTGRRADNAAEQLASLGGTGTGLALDASGEGTQTVIPSEGGSPNSGTAIL